MYTRCFERFAYNPYTDEEVYEVVNISPYGFEWYSNDRVIRTGCVEDMDADIESLLDMDFTEVL